MTPNHKTTDTQKIIHFIESSHNNISVEDIIQNSGAEKLRVYPILFELEQSDYLKVVDRDELGAPLVVCKNIS